MPEFNEVISKWDSRLREAIMGYREVKGDPVEEALYHEKVDLIDRFLHDLNNLKWDYT